MTADIELLPLPIHTEAGEFTFDAHVFEHMDMVSYARANVAHATAAKDAEIAGWKLAEKSEYDLRMEAEAEVSALRVALESERAARVSAQAGYTQQKARAERLAEALHKLEDSCEDSDGAQYGTLATSFVRGICRDALRDHDQEVGNG